MAVVIIIMELLVSGSMKKNRPIKTRKRSPPLTRERRSDIFFSSLQ